MEHLDDVFGRMGFNAREITALSGAHTLGRCHADRSGFEGLWTAEPLVFDNAYFIDLLNTKFEPAEAPNGCVTPLSFVRFCIRIVCVAEKETRNSTPPTGR